jgi:hypothetical protein
MLLHLLLECIGLTAKHFFFIQTIYKRKKKKRKYMRFQNGFRDERGRDEMGLKGNLKL